MFSMWSVDISLGSNHFRRVGYNAESSDPVVDFDFSTNMDGGEDDAGEFNDTFNEILTSLATLDEGDQAIADVLGNAGMIAEGRENDEVADDTTSETTSPKKRARKDSLGNFRAHTQDLRESSSDDSDGSSDRPKTTSSGSSFDMSIPHRMSWRPFVRRGIYSRAFSELTRVATFQTLYKQLEIESHKTDMDDLRTHAEIIADVTQIVWEHRNIRLTETIPLSGALVSLHPRKADERLDLEINDIIQYAYFKRRMSVVVHAELVNFALVRNESSAEQFREHLDTKYPNQTIADRYSVEDIVDWYHHAALPVAQGTGEVVRVDQILPIGIEKPFDEYVEMSLPLFMKTVKRLINLLDSDTRLNAAISLPPAVVDGNQMTALQILREWADRNGRAFSERVEIADGVPFIPAAAWAHDDDEGEEVGDMEVVPQYITDIIAEWRSTDRVPGPREDPVPEEILAANYPMESPDVTLRGNRDKFLRAILRSGVRNFPFGRTVFDSSRALPISKKEQDSFFDFLLPIQRLAVIDQEVYNVIKSLYVGTAGALFQYEKDLAKEKKEMEENGGKRKKGVEKVKKPVFSSAKDVVDMFHKKDAKKYAYLTTQHVVLWLRFVVQQNDNDEIEWIRRFVIPTETATGRSTGERTILFMESAFIHLVEHFLA